MIAEHSVLQLLELPRVELILDEGHDTLLSAAQTQHLTRSLEEVFGESVQLNIEPGKVVGETPAMRHAREQQERQAEAEQAIERDAKVQDLVAEFGGRVDQIRPI